MRHPLKVASTLLKTRARRASPRAKQRLDPTLLRPGYADRHTGATFLVFGNGPSLGKHRKQIVEFIETHKPVLMGANNMRGLPTPDYHGFTNRKRFIQFAHTIDRAKSKVLLGAYLADWIIDRHYRGPFERIMYVNDHDRAFDVREGIITASCRTVSVLLIGVALVMGAGRVLVAGLDGYGPLLSNNEEIYHYEGQTDFGPRNNKDAYLLETERYCSRFLNEISQYMVRNELAPFKIVTPTAYSDHYQDIRDYF